MYKISCCSSMKIHPGACVCGRVWQVVELLMWVGDKEVKGLLPSGMGSCP